MERLLSGVFRVALLTCFVLQTYRIPVCHSFMVNFYNCTTTCHLIFLFSHLFFFVHPESCMLAEGKAYQVLSCYPVVGDINKQEKTVLLYAYKDHVSKSSIISCSGKNRPCALHTGSVPFPRNHGRTRTTSGL